ncbi:MAG: ATP-binding cassette domain-containing protein [Sulfurovum sp.]|nr:ATP-binding cassette domain-containing protein [Sulfurovum sp.]
MTELLDLVNMQGMGQKYPHHISGGQQQRIAIARVLARQSPLVLFDEAFSSIDEMLKLKLIAQLKEIIHSQKKTAIFVTHDPKEAILLSDRIAYIEEGKIIQFDTPMQLHTAPNTPSVEALFGTDSFIFKRIEDLI